MKITIDHLLVGLIILIVLSPFISFKVANKLEMPNLVERDGYCKIQNGDSWKYDENNQWCYNSVNVSQEKITFTDKEFREVCPKVPLLSLRFFSDCFHKGGSR